MPRPRSAASKSKSAASANTAHDVERTLREHRNPEKAAFYPGFFQAGPGQYAEGDQFLGVVVPDQRKVARKYRQLSLIEVAKLLDSPFHECRLTGLFILVHQYEKAADDETREMLFDFYVDHLDAVNHWDLVDTTCHKIIGAQLLNGDRGLLFQLAGSGNLWRQRIAMVSTYRMIKHGDLEIALEIAGLLLEHPHDLIHKAVGWMLREVGNQDLKVMLTFLQDHHDQLPRTALRYAIEKLPPADRKRILQGSYPNV